MTDFNEAPVSINISTISPGGFSTMITLRGESLAIDELLKSEKLLLEKGFKPQPVKTFGFGPKFEKKVDYVEGRVCPKDKGRLVKGMTKAGKSFIKCENNKWDFNTKKSVGCSFIEWTADGPKADMMADFPDQDPNKATEKQKEFIIKLKTSGKITQDVNLDTISKDEARDLISSATGK